MEIKHTIEILTKDIQDIEKLVGNLQNSQDGTAIELDLALSKLRNVYEILTLIKADRLQGLLEPQEVHDPVALEKAVPEPEPLAESIPEPQPEPKSEPKPVPETTVETQPEPEPEQTREPEPVAESKPAPAPKKPKDAEILAEKFSSESRINENLGGHREKGGDAKLLGTPIDQISRNIGINDRFLIIRELFEGNSAEFGKLITDLDEAENYEVALRILYAHFADSMDHEGVEILSGLVKRRFLSV